MQRTRNLKVKLNNKRRWTLEDDKILIENYPSMGAKVTELIQGSTVSGCQKRALALRIKFNNKIQKE